MTKEEAIELFGSGYRLAKALGVSSQAVQQLPPGEIKDPRGSHVRVVAAERGLIPAIGGCPLGLDRNPNICSAGSCYVCLKLRGMIPGGKK